jgi:hypothetical protein
MNNNNENKELIQKLTDIVDKIKSIVLNQAVGIKELKQKYSIVSELT